MERDDWEDDYVEVSVPTELVRRVISGLSDIMMEWEHECRDKGEEFNAMIGTSAIHIAVQFIDRSMQRMAGETIQ
jgi:hypothetical protein